jgi:light-regulated signal transduction histidine kinase (bacteriophytochrome)
LQEPLRKVQAFGGQLKERYGRLLGEEGRDYLQRIEEATEGMQHMIEDLLAYSRIASMDPSFRRTDLNAVTREVLGDLEDRLAHSQGRVELGSLPVIDADPVQMRQLMQNLIGNALKFHRPETPPEVKVGVKTSTAHRIELFVEDNGIGFDIRNLERIFQPFQRLHGRSEYGGNGIGLAICRRIVERHGGSITAESTPGEGATFFITLPVRQTAE